MAFDDIKRRVSILNYNMVKEIKSTLHKLTKLEIMAKCDKKETILQSETRLILSNLLLREFN